MSNTVRTGAFSAEVKEDPVLWREKKRWLFLGIPWTFTSYAITERKLRISRGFFKKTEDDILLYRITDVTFIQTLCERIGRLGTLCVMSSDTSMPEAHLIHIKNSRKVKDLLMQKVEEARRKSGVYTSEIVGTGHRKPFPGNPEGMNIHEPPQQDTVHE